MHKKMINRFLSPQAIQLYFDVFSIIVAYVLYFLFKYYSGWFYNVVEPEYSLFFVPLLVLLFYWLLLFWVNGLYRDWYVHSPFDEFFTILRVTFFGSFILFFLIFLDSGDRRPRLIFVIYFLVMTVAVGAGRIFARQLQKKLRKEKKYVINAVLIGTADSMKEFARKVQLSPAWGYKILGGILLNGENENSSNSPYKDINILGELNDIEDIIKKENPDEILITRKTRNRQQLMKIVNMCINYGVKVKIIPDLYDIFTGTVKTLPVYGIPLIEIHTQLLKPWEEAIKRLIDIVVSLLVIVLGMPFWLIIAMIIKMESKGKALYTQERVGKDSRIFTIYKFRTMVQDKTMYDGAWTAVNDPRVTKFGRFLRKSHIDEVPQFLNVLKGEMSIVGPRPEQPVIVDKYVKIVPYYVRRLALRPGITGWWQVKYTVYSESVEEIESRLKDDFYYIENMSLKLDLEIMIRTVFLMIKGHGQT
jgi:exopolysaccharide biosynthesis polyprenyl glycosylphosphotransferase